MLRDMMYDTLLSCTRPVLVRKEEAGPFIDHGYVELIMDVTWQPECMLLGQVMRERTLSLLTTANPAVCLMSA
jgi:hypothetical protein